MPVFKSVKVCRDSAYYKNLKLVLVASELKMCARLCSDNGIVLRNGNTTSLSNAQIKLE